MTIWVGMVAGAILFLAGCSSGHNKPEPVLAWHANAGGLTSLAYKGTELSAGGYYAIASCTGTDDSTSVDSRVGDGTALRARTGSCPSIPWQFTSFRLTDNALRVHVVIGPMGADYATLSVPLDLVKDDFEGYAFAGGPVFVNGDSVSKDSPGGWYTQIPQPFTIPILAPPNNKVGFVHSRKPVPWVEAAGPFCRVRRSFNVGSSLTDVYVYRHPATHNLEASFHAVPRGATVVLDEDIVVYE